MFKLFTTEYKVIGRRAIGNDPFSDNVSYVNEYKKVMVPIWSRIIVAIVAIVIAIVSVIGVSIVLSSNGNAATSNTPTTMVEESTTTVAEVTAAMVEETTTTVAPIAVEYVCDTYTSSKEYVFQVAIMQDESTYAIPWETMKDRHIVMQTALADVYLEDFKADVNLFNQYTHMGVRVVDSSYAPTAEDYVVPVVMQDIPGDSSWADMTVGVTVADVFGIKVVDITSARLRLDQLAFENWQYHTHTILHEMGHLMGLDHTHGENGEQVKSIMSYESDRSTKGYLAGDIAGLKEVLCNK